MSKAKFEQRDPVADQPVADRMQAGAKVGMSTEVGYVEG